jgi:hypothetical protein
MKSFNTNVVVRLLVGRSGAQRDDACRDQYSRPLIATVARGGAVTVIEGQRRGHVRR